MELFESLLDVCAHKNWNEESTDRSAEKYCRFFCLSLPCNAIVTWSPSTWWIVLEVGGAS